MKKMIKALLLLVLAVGGGYVGYDMYQKKKAADEAEAQRLYEEEQRRLEEERRTEVLYLAAEGFMRDITDREGNVYTLPRGTAMDVRVHPTEEEDGTSFHLAFYDGKEFAMQEEDFKRSLEEVVTETEGYLTLPVVLYENSTGVEIDGMLNKGSHVYLRGFGSLQADGSVDRYYVECDDRHGWVRSKYVVFAEDQVPDTVDPVHYEREDRFGGGNAYTLDYPDWEKPHFENNVMPRECRTLYLNRATIDGIDAYIELANNSGINAFVIDMKESDGSGYKSPVMEQYSTSSYESGFNSLEAFKEAVQKCKDNGIYVIGRIVTFKDDMYAKDHPENVLAVNGTGEPFKLAGAYWPSAFSREVWEYNCKLAIEGVEEIGFNEIQFDYVRFPDRIYFYRDSMDFRNYYDESMAQAINRFLMYVTDELHERGAYVSADVFGETSNDYVCAYGQYWPMMSNIVDVMSAMPYPDHFETNAYGIYPAVWTQPGQLLWNWGLYVKARQEETKHPAVVRTWIQGYDTYKDPATVYDVYKIIDQIEGLYRNDLDGGYMIWNSPSELWRYYSYRDAFTVRRE